MAYWNRSSYLDLFNGIMSTKHKYIKYILLLLTLCLANKLHVFHFENQLIMYFLNCYFDDILGNVLFLLLIALAWVHFKPQFQIRLYHVLLLNIVCGLFWEYITPLYRTSTSDIWDVVAYMVGGLLFWYIFGGREVSYVTNSNK